MMDGQPTCMVAIPQLTVPHSAFMPLESTLQNRSNLSSRVRHCTAMHAGRVSHRHAAGADARAGVHVRTQREKSEGEAIAGEGLGRR